MQNTVNVNYLRQYSANKNGKRVTRFVYRVSGTPELKAKYKELQGTFYRPDTETGEPLYFTKMYMGDKGTYKDGASIRAKTAYGASHLLQWEVIKWMKDHAVITYDLCGTPPSDRINDTNHPHYGIGRFKTSFNKHVTDYIGAYDIVVKPMKYKLWTRLGERAALRLSKLRFGESWY